MVIFIQHRTQELQPASSSQSSTLQQIVTNLREQRNTIDVRYTFILIHIPCHRLIMVYLNQQTEQSITNNHLSLMLLLRVSISTRSFSVRYIQRHTSTANSDKKNFIFMWPCIVIRVMWPCIVICDRASWDVTVHRDMWPCIVTCARASWQISL
jgi:hypothetical protein